MRVVIRCCSKTAEAFRSRRKDFRRAALKAANEHLGVSAGANWIAFGVDPIVEDDAMNGVSIHLQGATFKKSRDFQKIFDLLLELTTSIVWTLPNGEYPGGVIVEPTVGTDGNVPAFETDDDFTVTVSTDD